MVLLLVPVSELKADRWIMVAPIVQCQCQCQCWPLAAGGLGRHGSWQLEPLEPGTRRLSPEFDDPFFSSISRMEDGQMRKPHRS